MRALTDSLAPSNLRLLVAEVVELVDTLASGASARKGVEVQVLFWAPHGTDKLTLNLSGSGL